MRALLVVALLVMAATLALVFRGRLRLLPLAIALAAAALTFGALSLAGASLTMASIAVLPVLIGLAVDYAIQLQSRVEEEAARAATCAIAPRRARRAALLGAPAVAVAAAATAAGFAVLALSPVPMVRGFGILLVAGIAIAFALRAAGRHRRARARRARRAARRAAPARRRRRAPRAARRAPPSGARAGRRRRARGRAPRRRRARSPTRSRRPGARAGDRARASPPCGWALDTQTRVESDIQRLVPQDMPALRDLDALQRSTGVGGEVDVVIEGADLTQPARHRTG